MKIRNYNNVEISFEGTYQRAIEFLQNLQARDSNPIPSFNVRLYVDVRADVIFPITEEEKEQARAREIL